MSMTLEYTINSNPPAPKSVRVKCSYEKLRKRPPTLRIFYIKKRNFPSANRYLPLALRYPLQSLRRNLLHFIKISLHSASKQ